MSSSLLVVHDKGSFLTASVVGASIISYHYRSSAEGYWLTNLDEVVDSSVERVGVLDEGEIIHP